MLEAGDVFAGYTIRRRLGVGGMGMVYLARHPRLPRLIALKLLNPNLYTDNEIRRRFEREADLAAQLDHPNIVTVYDRGTEDRQLWISMQFVPGSDASAADVDVLAPGRAVQIIGETAAALDFAHANGVLHRDVKPGNILLAKAPIGHPERVLLTDFGIAGMRDSETTLADAGSITATLAYAAPEQLVGAKLDPHADQYSLACTLFWLLTGAAPYPGKSPAAVIHAHLHAPVPQLSRIRPGLPPALDNVLARALAKQPADRFASCLEFAAAARRALAASLRRPAALRQVAPATGAGPTIGPSPHPGHAPMMTGADPSVAAAPRPYAPRRPPTPAMIELPGLRRPGSAPLPPPTLPTRQPPPRDLGQPP
ncbi:serine/threonine-protein kinase [Nocardia donostiensis]|uniref:non-specific serine/threonine protein kinase n=1 Tax=Nocardia donostiensis TaxID=1538463 RepID=A0A1W0AQW7_9NOCA|nr:serine/threonine protein kinase [Nocardia donostiensis]OQS12584.1 serine/threonine protein kinase [Nocardia donostiensis]OQS18944.1 serine/threonine protein kinase [Nocardia donostiensis]